MTDILVWASSLGLIALAFHWTRQRRQLRPLLWALAVLAVVLGLLTSTGVVEPPWKGELRSRGESETSLTLVLYGAMLAGMISHYLFFHLRTPKNRRRRFDIGNLLAPVFISPIVFLPLASVFESVRSNPAIADAAHLMLFLVAFENGFFWREFFENRQKALNTQGE